MDEKLTTSKNDPSNGIRLPLPIPTFDDREIVKILKSELVIKGGVLHYHQEYEADEEGELYYRNRRRDIRTKFINAVEVCFIQDYDYWQVDIQICGGSDLMIVTKTQKRAEQIRAFINQHIFI